MSKMEYAERFERVYMDCVGQYIGPTLPGFPFDRGDIIHVNYIGAAAEAFRYAIVDAKDRERVAV